MIVRRATDADATAIAKIHVDAWRAAYGGIVPASFLDSLSIEAREKVWRGNLERRDSETWVAEDRDEIVGWLSAGASRDAGALPSTGEVWGLYVAPAHWRRGVGRRLCSDTEGYLVAAGFSDMTLWVLKKNVPAIAFYQSIGMAIEPTIEKTSTRTGAELVEVRLRKRLV